ncbi:hypothetical protein [Microbacterium sp. NPDC087665]|uniref:hypothetical protein n=1 Tax=Microbacterium sp. NPDC087665 TaxID=3364194 RepID=UPI0038051098
MTQSPPAAEAVATRLLAERVKQLERAVLVFPVMVIEVLLAASLVLPFVRDTVDDEDTSVTFFDLALALLAPTDDGDADEADVLFGIAFIVLVVVIIATLIAVAVTLRSAASRAAEITLSIAVGLLLAGTLGAWLTVSMFLSKNNPPSIEMALPVLTVAALLAAVFAFPPVYRSIREP